MAWIQIFYIITALGILCQAAPSSNSTDSSPTTVSQARPSSTIVRTTLASPTNGTAGVSPSNVATRFRTARSVLNGTQHDESSEEEKDDDTSIHHTQFYQAQIPVHVSDSQRVSSGGIPVGSAASSPFSVNNVTRPSLGGQSIGSQKY